MANIAKAYAKLYKDNAKRFLWAGFAAIAVQEGVPPAATRSCGITELPGLVRIGKLTERELGVQGAQLGFAANYGVPANYARFPERWDWLSNVVYPAFLRWAKTDADGLNREIDRIIGGRK